MIAFVVIKTVILLGLAGYQIIMRLVDPVIYHIQCALVRLHANLRVSARVYDVEGGAIFSKNSTFVFFDGAAWTPPLLSPSPIMAPGRKTRVHFLLTTCVFKNSSFLECDHSPILSSFTLAQGFQ